MGSKSTIFENGLSIYLKRKDFDQCILRLLSNALKTWILTSKTLRKIKKENRGGKKDACEDSSEKTENMTK